MDTSDLQQNRQTEGSKAFPVYASDDSINNIFIKFINHPSIQTSRQKLNITSKCLFQSVFVNNVKQAIKDLNSNKSVNKDVPENILKECEFTISVFVDRINKSFETDLFQECLKEANITLIFKKNDPLDKKNYHSWYTSAAL